MSYRLHLLEALEQERRQLPLSAWEERSDINTRIRDLKASMMRPPSQVGTNSRP